MCAMLKFALDLSGYIGDFEIIDDRRAGKIVVDLNGRINKVSCVMHIFFRHGHMAS